MAYYESLVDLIVTHRSSPPQGHAGAGRDRAGEGRVLQPGRLGQGSHRRPDDRRRRAVRRAPAGGTIVEPTSATPESAWPSWPSSAGYRCIFVCPDKVSGDKIDTLRAYGAEVVVCPTAVAPEDPRSYTPSRTARRETPGAGSPTSTQREQPALALRDHRSRAVGATEGRVTHFVAGVGTGGTIAASGASTARDRWSRSASAGCSRWRTGWASSHRASRGRAVRDGVVRAWVLGGNRGSGRRRLGAVGPASVDLGRR